MLTISPTSAAIKRYSEELAQYDTFDAQHELARKTAFQSLLQAVARDVKWTLIPEEPLANGKRPDRTLREEFHLSRGSCGVAGRPNPCPGCTSGRKYAIPSEA
jgi:hypothetical protein